jgi:hypothetical protein
MVGAGMKTYNANEREPQYGRLARYDKDYRRWRMAQEELLIRGEYTEVSWRACRIAEAVNLELSLVVEWLMTTGQIERER